MRGTTRLALIEIRIALEQQVDALWGIQDGEEVSEREQRKIISKGTNAY